jgi:hypothetical protein
VRTSSRAPSTGPQHPPAADAGGFAPATAFSRRLVGAAAFALAIAAGVIVVANLGPTGPDGRSRSAVPGLPGVPVAAAEVLERAAVAAEEKPFAAPRDDKWSTRRNG